MTKDFLFTPGIWLGEGKVTFNTSPEFLKFYTRWEIKEESPGVLKAVQIVETEGIEEHVINTVTFYDFEKESFKITFENNEVGKVIGKGRYNEKMVSWELRGESDFEGFEVYEKQENGDLFLHAEYGNPPEYRTIIEGIVWRKGS